MMMLMMIKLYPDDAFNPFNSFNLCILGRVGLMQIDVGTGALEYKRSNPTRGLRGCRFLLSGCMRIQDTNTGYVMIRDTLIHDAV